MRPTRSSSTSVLFALLLFASLLVGFSAGCGGGDERSGGRQQQQNDGAPAAGASREQGGGTGQEEGRPQIKIVPGTIESVDPEAGTLVLRPTRGEPMTFAIRPWTRIELDGGPAQLADLREGQAGQVRYVVREGENRARRVVAFGDPGGEEETTG